MSKGMFGMLSLSEVQGPRGTLDELLAGENGEQVLRELKRFNRKEPCWVPNAQIVAPDIFRLTVDYGQTLEQMIAAGRYDWTNSAITAERFPIVGDGIVEFEARLFHWGRNISSDNAVKEIKQEDAANPWAPAKIEHELAFGTSFPEEQRKYPVIALGSVAKVGGDRFVPSLSRGGSYRLLLRLRWYDSGWLSICRFLAVRKVSVS